MKNIWVILIIGIVLGIIVKSFAFEVFTVPTNSMEPTILRGSKIWVNKFFYTHFYKKDIVGFEHAGESFVKRIVAVPKDTVYFDGKRYDYQAVFPFPYTIPSKGYTIYFDEKNTDFYLPLIVQYEGIQAGNVLNTLYINGLEAKSYTFTQNYYFLQGDNIEESIDSRAWGLIPEKALFGKVINPNSKNKNE
jgi:signal peptidase I